MNVPVRHAASGEDLLLARLEGVQRSGKGHRALCPSCGGRSRKLSVLQTDDGRVLLHCFGGCAAVEVIGAVGLTLADLFPEPLAPQTPEQRRATRRQAQEAGWGAALGVLEREATVVLIGARSVRGGNSLSTDDDARLVLAVDRIESARMVFRGR